MNDEIERQLRKAESQYTHAADQELVEMRHWYYRLPAEDRRQFKQYVQSLAGISGRFRNWDMSVKVHYDWTQFDETGGVVCAERATGTPGEILQAIEQWEETEPLLGGS